jgi:hypothetical protein
MHGSLWVVKSKSRTTCGAVLDQLHSTFAVDKDDLLCKPMLGMIRYLSMSESEVQQAIEKDKLPKGKASGETLSKALAVFRARLSQYASSAEVRIQYCR